MGDDFPGYDGLELAVLRRYVAGRSEPAEQRLVEAWAAEKADRRRYLEAMRLLHDHGSPDARDATALAWTRIAARMEPPAEDRAAVPAYVAPWESVVRVDVRRRTPRVLSNAFAQRRRWPAALAAAATLVAVVGGSVLLDRGRSLARSSASAVGMRQIATAKGQRTEFQLSDGTRVVLGVDSRLRFPERFGAGSRELYLDGTAYFDVVHDATRPFTVHTSNAVVQDIGTRFIVTAYPGPQTTQVVVDEGLVSLGATRASPSAHVVLARGQLGQLAPSDSLPSVRAVDPAGYEAWLHGELAFRDTPLAAVATELGRWYEGEVRLGDSSLADVPITATFAGESLREVVGVVTTVAPVRAVWHGPIVTLYRR